MLKRRKRKRKRNGCRLAKGSPGIRGIAPKHRHGFWARFLSALRIYNPGNLDE